MSKTDLSDAQLDQFLFILKTAEESAPEGEERRYLATCYAMARSNDAMAWTKFHRYMQGLNEMSPVTAAKVRKALGLPSRPVVSVAVIPHARLFA